MARLVTHGGATVLGISTITSNSAEADPARGKIPGLWGRFSREDVFGAIPGKKAPAVPVSVYSNYESDQTGQYQLVIGAAVDAEAPTPDGMLRVPIPAGRYLLFEGEGAMPGVVVETWKAVWRHFSEPSAGHVRAYTTDFEMYPGDRSVQIYISVT